MIIIILLVIILGVVDWQTGFELNFFVFYFIPISISAWIFGIELSIIISMLCSIVWFVAGNQTGYIYPSNFIAVWNTVIRLFSFIIISYSTANINKLYILSKTNYNNLQNALLQIKTLESFLSICCVCKKIRNEKGNWQQIESYISDHANTVFSHGYCPECGKKAMEQFELYRENSQTTDST